MTISVQDKELILRQLAKLILEHDNWCSERKNKPNNDCAPKNCYECEADFLISHLSALLKLANTNVQKMHNDREVE